MAYIITILKPERSKHGVATSPTGQHYNHIPKDEIVVTTLDEAIEAMETRIDDAQDALGEEEGARRYFEPARRAALAMSPEGGRVELPDGYIIEVEFWGATRAVNWMVENGHDPATENFIDAYKKRA